MTNIALQLAEYRQMTDAVARLLPPVVYSDMLLSSRICRIERGVREIVPVEGASPEDTADSLNAALRPPPTHQQVRAMEAGAVFGWDAPGADPRHPAHAVPCSLWGVP